MITKQISTLSIVFVVINTIVMFRTNGAPLTAITGMGLSVIYLIISYILLRKKVLLTRKDSWKIILFPVTIFFLDLLIGFASNGNSMYRALGSILFFGIGTFYIWNYSNVVRWEAIVILITPFMIIYCILPLICFFGNESNVSTSATPFFLSSVFGVVAGLISVNFSRKGVVFLFLLISSYLYSFPLYQKILPFLQGGEKLVVKVENANTPSFITQQGDTLNLHEIKQDILILDFWFYGCVPCEVGFPKLEELHRSYINDPKVFISTVRYFPGGKTNGINGFEHLVKYSFNKLDLVKETQGDWGVSAFPTYLVFDKHRNLRYKGSLITGTPISERDIDRLIADLKAEN